MSKVTVADTPFVSTQTFVQMPVALLDSGVGWGALATYMTIRRYAWKVGSVAHLGVNALAEMRGVDRRTVSRDLAALESVHAISSQRRGRGQSDVHEVLPYEGITAFSDGTSSVSTHKPDGTSDVSTHKGSDGTSGVSTHRTSNVPSEASDGTLDVSSIWRREGQIQAQQIQEGPGTERVSADEESEEWILEAVSRMEEARAKWLTSQPS